MSKNFSGRAADIRAKKYLMEVTGIFGAAIFILILIQAGLGICGVAFALFLKNLINAAMAGEKSLFLREALFLLIIVTVRLVLNYIYKNLNEYTKSAVENRCKQRLFATLLKKDFYSVTAVHSAKWMNCFTSDCQTVANHLVEILPGLVGMLVQMVSACFVLLVMEPLLVWLIIPAGILLLVFSTLFRKRMKQLHKEIQEADGELRVSLQESLSGMTMVRALAEEEWVKDSASCLMGKHRKSRMRRSFFSSFCNLGFGFLMQGGYWAAAVFCGWRILNGTMTVGSLVAVTQLIGQVQGPMGNISCFVPRYYAMLASAERLLEAEQLADETDEEVWKLDKVLEFYHNSFNRIHLSQVDFSYPNDGKPLLENFSLTVKKGDVIGFIGHSGCGKSTVFRLILSLYIPQKGGCFIEDRNGTTYGLKQFRRLFAYVPQGKFFMTGRIREIVCFSDTAKMKEDREIWSALKTACAEEFVRELPEQLDTVLGEQGTGLSEGQLQRLSVARAVFSGRPVLLLDEATSALDADTELQLLHSLKSMKDRTVLLVTHRPAALAICDSVINFEKGDQ